MSNTPEPITGTPVRNPDGSLENFLLNIGGKRYRCKCGCNVFSKPDSSEPELYECNACGQWYEAE